MFYEMCVCDWTCHSVWLMWSSDWELMRTICSPMELWACHMAGKA